MTTPTEQSPLSKLLLHVDAIADGAAADETVPTGFPSIDRLLGGGMRRGDLIVLGGDVAVGKSSLALAIALRAANAGRVVEFLTSEMSPARVNERALAIEGRASIDALRTGSVDETTRASLGAAALRMQHALPIVGRIPPGGAASVAEVIRHRDTVDVVVIDSLQGIPSGAQPQDEELACAVRMLKSVAVDVDVPILLTAHLPNLPRERSNLRPTLEDFGALGAVKQHGDVVLGLYREELYQPTPGHEGATELAILKNRSGATSYVDLYFYKQWLRFEDMVD